MGCIAFTPLAQGLLTGKYLNGIPEGSRMQREGKSSRADGKHADGRKPYQPAFAQ